MYLGLPKSSHLWKIFYILTCEHVIWLIFACWYKSKISAESQIYLSSQNCINWIFFVSYCHWQSFSGTRFMLSNDKKRYQYSIGADSISRTSPNPIRRTLVFALFRKFDCYLRCRINTIYVHVRTTYIVGNYIIYLLSLRNRTENLALPVLMLLQIKVSGYLGIEHMRHLGTGYWKFRYWIIKIIWLNLKKKNLNLHVDVVYAYFYVVFFLIIFN